jgi:hypothetical protein
LEEILEVAVVDGDPWVAMVAEILKTYPATGALNMEIGSATDEYTRKIFNDLANDLRKLGKWSQILNIFHRGLFLMNLNIIYSEKTWRNWNASIRVPLFK